MMIFGKKLLNIKRAFYFFSLLLSETLFILKRIRQGTVINVRMSPFKVPVILPDFSET